MLVLEKIRANYTFIAVYTLQSGICSKHIEQGDDKYMQ